MMDLENSEIKFFLKCYDLFDESGMEALKFDLYSSMMHILTYGVVSLDKVSDIVGVDRTEDD